MKTYEDVEGKPQEFLISALDVSGQLDIPASAVSGKKLFPSPQLPDRL
jgi:hypothetical protein